MSKYALKDDDTQNSCVASITENNEKISLLSLQVDKLNNCISDLKSLNLNMNRATSGELASHESGLFSTDSSGNRIINPCKTLDKNPTNCIDSCNESTISNELKLKVSSVLSQHNIYFTKDDVEIATFGYPNLLTETTRGRSHSGTIPSAINDVITALDPHNNKNLNSVVVKRFSKKGSTADNYFVNKIITPESDIYTLALGGPFKITFNDKVTNQDTVIDINDNNCFIMSQQSQFYWSHKINCDVLAKEYQYTISFLSASHNHNSTLIIGDSNTYNIKFQSERERSSLGKYITGKRYTCYIVENIELEKCLGYQNIIFHLGINNLKDRSHSNIGLNGRVDISAVFDSWLSTLITIRNLCPYSKIIVSPIMPTKIRALNTKAIAFNRLIFSCINKFWFELDFNSFVNESGLLDDNFGRHYNAETGRMDRIHLGRLGIARLGLMYKDAILGKAGIVNGRSYADVIRGRGPGSDHIS